MRGVTSFLKFFPEVWSKGNPEYRKHLLQQVEDIFPEEIPNVRMEIEKKLWVSHEINFFLILFK